MKEKEMWYVPEHGVISKGILLTPVSYLAKIIYDLRDTMTSSNRREHEKTNLNHSYDTSKMRNST